MRNVGDRLNTKFKSILENITYTFIANIFTMLISVIMTLILPKFLGVTEYSYYQLYIFFISYVGFFHTDRPGRMSLALDLMEEFRSVMVDRFVLTLINKKIMKEKYFIKKENGAVIMTDEGRKAFLSAWQSKKQETIKHPFLDEKIEWGMAPYVQSMLLARYLRGDLDEYPPFFWK